MNQEYLQAYNKLNSQQQKAVRTIDGPVMVIAGPGTGKTQLLSTRVAYILQNTDTTEENILCLTYTESAVETMKNRLLNLIGSSAYKVNILTYHSFGTQLIQNYPFYFKKYLAFEPASDVSLLSLISNIQSSLPYTSTLKNKKQTIKIKDFLLSIKNSSITPADLENIIMKDQLYIKKINNLLKENTESLRRITKKSAEILGNLTIEDESNLKLKTIYFTCLSEYLLNDLLQALNEFNSTNKTKPLTNFKNKWLTKDSKDNYVIKWQNHYQQLLELTTFYKKYLDIMKENKLLDYSDMILEVTKSLEKNPDFLFSLQEKYQYIMIDEFQDSNETQNYLIHLLGNNKVNENRPNIMIVGDDDQAIFAFQGANYSHMRQFYKEYNEVEVISLKKNYRSTKKIIDFSQQIVKQIPNRIIDILPNITKELTSTEDKSKNSEIVRLNFISEIDQLDWIGKYCLNQKNTNKKLNDIAIIAPKHRYLEALIPYFNKYDIPINYERRNNVLSDPLINQIITICKLIINLSITGDKTQTNALWSEVLSSSFWELSTINLWDISQKSYKESTDWSDIVLNNKETMYIGQFIISLSQQLNNFSAEEIIDFIIGQKTYPLLNYRSPFFDFYFKDIASFSIYQELLSNLITLRQNFIDFQKSAYETMKLTSFIEFIELNLNLNQTIINNNLHYESDNAVSLLTVHKAKGQEFKTIIIYNTNEETWGMTTKNATNLNFTMPPDLVFINYQNAETDEQIRSFFVTVSRAKKNLIMLNYQNKTDTKTTSPLSFLNETISNNIMISPYISQTEEIKLITDRANIINLSNIKEGWQDRHLRSLDKKTFKNYLKKQLETFQLSPTNFNDFLDIVSSGPNQFFMNHILRFPISSSPQIAYGDAIHSTIQWINNTMKTDKSFNNIKKINNEFEHNLKKQRILSKDFNLLLDRGKKSLEIFFQQKKDLFLTTNVAEYSLKNDGVFLNNAHLTGRIDNIIINEKNKSLKIIDYKTAHPFNKWKNNNLSYNYQKQLCFYKLLLNHSSRFKHYRVDECSLIFIDPNEEGNITELKLINDQEIFEKITRLIPIVWDLINNLTFPDINKYPKNIYGIKTFENELIMNLKNNAAPNL